MSPQDDINQDTNIPKNNPLFGSDLQHNFQPSEAVPTKKPIKLFVILSLVVLSSIILGLNTIIQNTKNKTISKNTDNEALPADIKTTIPANNLIPTQFVDKFKRIQDNINTSEDFQPPQIDTEIGI